MTWWTDTSRGPLSLGHRETIERFWRLVDRMVEGEAAIHPAWLQQTLLALRACPDAPLGLDVNATAASLVMRHLASQGGSMADGLFAFRVQSAAQAVATSEILLDEKRWAAHLEALADAAWCAEQLVHIHDDSSYDAEDVARCRFLRDYLEGVANLLLPLDWRAIPVHLPLAAQDREGISDHLAPSVVRALESLDVLDRALRQAMRAFPHLPKDCPWRAQLESADIHGDYFAVTVRR